MLTVTATLLYSKSTRLKSILPARQSDYFGKNWDSDVSTNREILVSKSSTVSCFYTVRPANVYTSYQTKQFFKITNYSTKLEENWHFHCTASRPGEMVCFRMSELINVMCGVIGEAVRRKWHQTWNFAVEWEGLRGPKALVLAQLNWIPISTSDSLSFTTRQTKTQELLFKSIHDDWVKRRF